MTIKFAIITCSDTRTLETDEAGQKLEQLIAEQGWECVHRVVEMDERPFIAGALIDACDNTDADIVLTCGGSGLSLRDVTPEDLQGGCSCGECGGDCGKGCGDHDGHCNCH